MDMYRLQDKPRLVQISACLINITTLIEVFLFPAFNMNFNYGLINFSLICGAVLREVWVLTRWNSSDLGEN